MNSRRRRLHPGSVIKHGQHDDVAVGRSDTKDDHCVLGRICLSCCLSHSVRLFVSVFVSCWSSRRSAVRASGCEVIDLQAESL